MGNSTVFGEFYGEGTPQVLWLHGWARRGEDFTDAARELAARGVASVVLDLPGSGASPPPAVAGGARDYAEVVAAATEDLPPLVVVGHSFGGRIATVLASRHPEAVTALVLTGTPLLRLAPTRRAPIAYRAQRWMARHRLISSARLEAARQRYGSPDYRAASGVMRDVLVAMVNETYEEELRSLRVPVVLLWGENDLEVPVAVAREAAALAPDATLNVLSDVGHFVPLEAPTALVDVVVRALGQ